MKLTLKIWRQTGRKDKGRFVSYAVDDVNPEMSMLECLDVLNETLIERGEEPVAFEHDCREGICGSCGFMINGIPHGPLPATTVCQLTMRHFKDGEELVIEPWRAAAFPADQGPGRGPALVRSHHCGGRLHLGVDRECAGWQRDSGQQGHVGSRDGCGGVHRLRRVRGGVPECIVGAVYRREDCAPEHSAAGRSRSGTVAR